MKAKLTAAWAASVPASRREPTASEISTGFPCGPADIGLFNEQEYRRSMVEAELSDLVTKSGLTPSESDLLQVAQAVRSQSLNYRVAGGTANALTVTLDPAPAALADLIGTPIRVKIAATNTGAATLKVGALAAMAITRADATPLKAGDLFAGAITELIYDGARYQLAGVLTSALPTESVISYTAPGTYSFIVPAGITRLKRVRMWGGGGSGGGTDASVSSAGAGGGGGGYVETANVPVTPGASITIIVGAGGAAVTGAPGLAGGASSMTVSPVLTAGGGGLGGALGGGISTSPGAGGGASGGNVINLTGGGGGTGLLATGGVISGVGGAGFGTSQSGPNAQSNGSDGIRFGGGGAGGSSNGSARAGGAGAAGAVIIEY